MEKNTFPFLFAKRYGVILTELTEDHAVVVYRHSPSPFILNEIRRKFGKPLLLKKEEETVFSQRLLSHYETDSNTAMLQAEDLGDSFNLSDLIEELPKTEDLLEKQDEAPIIRLLNALLSEAIKVAASDVHIETFEETISIRFRVDGVLREVLKPQRILAPLMVSRIKVMAKLDISEKRLPQDGRITLRLAGRAVDVRVSTMPTSHGERVVLRLLDKQSARLDLKELGMESLTLERMQALIKIPHGIILVTGPTGSGKTTTLYAALTSLNNETRNILTIEDPIEYDLKGIGQTQVNHKVQMTFAKGLRAILRQDPDVVMVGEIRDVETAQIAIQASLTGHLVLSTLHTNSAIGAITRLTDMGIEPFLLSSSMIGVLAQRLTRLLCKACKKPRDASPQECILLGVPHAILHHPTGCEYCRGSGYSGRSGVYELITLDDPLRAMIHDRAKEQDIKHYVRALYPGIRQDGFYRVLKGDTTLEEILRITNEE